MIVMREMYSNHEIENAPIFKDLSITGPFFSNVAFKKFCSTFKTEIRYGKAICPKCLNQYFARHFSMKKEEVKELFSILIEKGCVERNRRGYKFLINSK